MAFIRNCFFTVVLVFGILPLPAQTVYYPAASSQLLKSTASDVAMLLQKAIPGSHFSTQSYTIVPATGIVFIYDSSITDNQACHIESNGTSFIRFNAFQDNGLNFGVYQYLQLEGFRFYQPGSIWEIIPLLTSPFKQINTTLTCTFKYKTWNISGGHSRWAMDNNPDYGWDTYFGENGHNWALYQRRNGMTGSYRFAGHRGDIMSTGPYMSILQNNPCYVAAYDGSRTATSQSVADIHNTAAMQSWGDAIGNRYTQFRNTIVSNANLYADYYHNFNYSYNLIGLEVPDGAHFGNSKDNGGCTTQDYPKETDQHFTLANYAAQKINAIYPDKHFQLYAYANHADVPSAGISVNNNMDVQVIPAAFQNESSPVGIVNRWYAKTNNISEYHYLNIPQWGGETPMFYLDELKQTVLRAKEKNSQGIIWEASPAKFASLPFLLAANKNMVSTTAIDSTLRQFCDEMFEGANNTIYKLLQAWSDDKTVTMGDFMEDNKYKIPYYFQLLSQAVAQSQNAAPVVKDRVRELKAYLHYMVLYYDWLFDQRSNMAKKDKAAALCTYLAKINKMELVNSYFLIADITSRYAVTDNFYIQYNTANGTAYQGGNLPLLTSEETDNNFQLDNSRESSLVQQYKFEEASFTQEQFNAKGMIPLEKITVRIGYTNGADYPARCEYFINAATAGTFNIAYTPHFNMAGKGYINFTVEATDNAMQVIKDVSLDPAAGGGTISISLPSAGNYKLSVVSHHQSSVDMVINTNGNYFYKKGPFLGNKIENYRDNLLSLPGYFHVPAGISKVYFSINNSNPGGRGFATADDISKAFVIKDNNGNTLLPRLVTPDDSAFFYMDVPAGTDNSFWQVYKMEQYNLCFANITNLQWYAARKPCSNANFTVSVISKDGNCITRLVAGSNSSNLHWEIYDDNRWLMYDNQSVVDLPSYITSKAIVTLWNGKNCSVTKAIEDDDKFMRAKEACLKGELNAPAAVIPVLYPDPSTGIFNIMQNGSVAIADDIIISDLQGRRMGSFKNARQFNISNAAAGLYWYHMSINGHVYNGKLIKL